MYKNTINKLPISLIAIITSVCIIGFVTLYSAADGACEPWVNKQLLHFCLFMPIAIVIAIVDLNIIYRFSYIFYFVVLLLLLGVELFGVVAMGGKRWFSLGFTKIQPSELAKIAITMMLARYFHNIKQEDVDKLSTLLIAIILVFIPALLIIKQPDLGTGIITILIATVIFFIVGVAIKKFIAVGICICISLPIAWHFMYDYQRNRVLMFLDPTQDQLGAGYNIIQSKIAIGSGGLTGKGLLQGTQSHLSFLPEHQTDFIFASFVEEMGFIGGSMLIILYASIVIMCIIISSNSKTIFGRLLVAGINAIFFSHIFINIGMVMGLLPVVGIPLPFMSYGGTMIASTLIGLGLVMNVHVHRHQSILS